MPRKESKRRAVNGSGTIRKKTIKKPNGKTYQYWEGRVTTGYDPLTGQQTQRTVTGKTQKEVAQKLREMSHEVATGTYIDPVRITVAQWFEEWQANYLTNVKASTAFIYQRKVRLHILPALGNIQLQKLSKALVQRWINGLVREGLSPKSVKDLVGILHRSMEDAIEVEYIGRNPAHKCRLPPVTATKVNHLEYEDIERFLTAIEGHIHERLFKVALFTGLRENEVLGLTWDCIDFKNNCISVTKQLCRERCKGGQYYFAPPKDNEERTIVAAPTVMALLQEQRQAEAEKQSLLGKAWEGKNMVFSNPTGGFLSYRTVYDCYKRVTRQLGLEVRFHELRHAYTSLSLQGGDDIKTVQGNLGHATPEFTLKVYAHVNKKMKQASAERMENVIQGLFKTE